MRKQTKGEQIVDLKKALSDALDSRDIARSRLGYIGEILNITKSHHGGDIETIKKKIGELIAANKITGQQRTEIESLKIIISMALVKTNVFYPKDEHPRMPH